MKSAPLRTKLKALRISPSFSRPRVSNDNPCSEALFRTLKYRPSRTATTRERQPERGASPRHSTSTKRSTRSRYASAVRP